MKPERFLFADEGSAAPPAGPLDGAQSACFDAQTLWDRIGGDLELLGDLVEIFAAENPGTMRLLESAVGHQQGADVQKLAHKLKGSLLQFSAARAASLAASLEQMGKNQSLDSASACLQELKTETKRVIVGLELMVHKSRPQ